VAFKYGAFLLVLTLNAFAADRDGRCTCEDWDRDGRYGIVIHENGRKKVLRSNDGSYDECQQAAADHPACRPRGGRPDDGGGRRHTVCTCEDWDHDQRYGVIHYDNKRRVLRPNYGPYASGILYARGLPQCDEVR